MMPQFISKRTFLQGVAVAGIASSVLVYQFTSGVLIPQPMTPSQQILAYVENEDALSVAVGIAYLETDFAGKKENNQVELIAKLLSSIKHDTTNMKQKFAHSIRDDFKENRTCLVEGWTLSRTECRLSALAFLLKGRTLVPEVGLAPQPRTLADMPEAEFGTVERWGPQHGKAGEPFNKQPNGNSSIWLKFIGLERGEGYTLFFGDVKMRTTVHFSNNLLTADLSAEETVQSTLHEGKRPIYIVNLTKRQKQFIGEYQVEGDTKLPASTPSQQGSQFVTVVGWGPSKGKVGKPFNVQPNGSSAIWLKLEGNIGKQYQLYYGSIPMETRLHQSRKLITASLSPEKAAKATATKGNHPIYIVDTKLKEKQLVGFFTLMP